MTIKEAIAKYETKIELQGLMLATSVTDAARLKCINTIEKYELRIKELIKEM